MRSFITHISIGLVFILSACSGEPESGNLSEDLDFIVSEQQTLEVSEELISDLINSIPSPVETASVIRASGANYNSAILADPKKTDNFINQYTQAVALGAFGADLGYMNIYGKTAASMSYLNSIRNLSNKLNIGQFFDFNTLRRLASSSGNIDSLLQVSTESFNKMNFQLSEQKRSNIGVLLVTGTWLESVHLTCQIIRETNSKDLIERLGEQKITIDNLWIMLDVYKNEPFFNELMVKMEPLKKEFDDITISYIYAEPIRKEVDGRLVIEDNSSSVININQAHVDNITKAINDLRAFLII